MTKSPSFFVPCDAQHPLYQKTTATATAATILAAAGYNFRRLIRWLRILLRLFLAMLFAPPNTLPA